MTMVRSLIKVDVGSGSKAAVAAALAVRPVYPRNLPIYRVRPIRLPWAMSALPREAIIVAVRHERMDVASLRLLALFLPLNTFSAFFVEPAPGLPKLSKALKDDIVIIIHVQPAPEPDVQHRESCKQDVASERIAIGITAGNPAFDLPLIIIRPTRPIDALTYFLHKIPQLKPRIANEDIGIIQFPLVAISEGTTAEPCP
jgi:hypothetical protein